MYYIFRRLLETSLYYRVKNTSLKNVAIALSLLDNNSANTAIFKNPLKT